jgi:hypothetical protein
MAYYGEEVRRTGINSVSAQYNRTSRAGNAVLERKRVNARTGNGSSVVADKSVKSGSAFPVSFIFYSLVVTVMLMFIAYSYSVVNNISYEIGELEETIMRSQNISPVIEKVKALLDLLESELSLAYSTHTNTMVNILTVAGLLLTATSIILSFVLYLIVLVWVVLLKYSDIDSLEDNIDNLTQILSRLLNNTNNCGCNNRLKR